MIEMFANNNCLQLCFKVLFQKTGNACFPQLKKIFIGHTDYFLLPKEYV